MQHDLVVEGYVVSPEGLKSLELGITDGKIAEIKKQGLTGTKRIDAGRSLIFPGFVDIHVHMREPGWEKKEDFRTGSLAALHGGVTTVVDMPNNPKPTTNSSAVAEKRRLADANALVDVRFYGGLEVGGLAEVNKIREHVVGYKVYLAKSTGGMSFPPRDLGKAFEIISKTKRPVSLHCEDQAIIDERTKKLKDVKRADLHADLRPPEAEVEAVRSSIAMMRETPSLRANVCHASTSDTLRLVESARGEGLRLDSEAALHHLYYNRKAMLENSLLKTNPPLREESDRAALVQGLRDGRISFLVTDHAPHLREEKLSEELSGVPGLDDYGHLVSWLIRSEGADLSVIARAASYKPARFVGLADRGKIEEGFRADLTILDIRSPEKVKADDVRSKCGWSPYEGKEFPGRVRWTIRAGEVMLEDYELIA